MTRTNKYFKRTVFVFETEKELGEITRTVYEEEDGSCYVIYGNKKIPVFHDPTKDKTDKTAVWAQVH